MGGRETAGKLVVGWLGGGVAGYWGGSSKLGVFGDAREGDDVADVLHPRGVHNGPLKAQAEAGVGDGAVAAQVAIPVVGLLVQPHLVHAAVEDIEALFALRSADDFADTG